MRAEAEGLLDGALGKIVRGVVAGDGAAVVGKLRGGKLIHFALCAASTHAGYSPAQGGEGGAVTALDERAGIGGDGPRGPLARFVGGGPSAGGGGIDGRAAREVFSGLEGVVIEHENFYYRPFAAHVR